MKKRTAVLMGILAMLAVITSVGLTAIFEKPMIPKPIKKIPWGRTKYIPSKPGDEFKTMLPGAVFRPAPKIVGYFIIGERIRILPPRLHGQRRPGDRRPGDTRLVVTGENLRAKPISRGQLKQLEEATSTSVTVPLVTVPY